MAEFWHEWRGSLDGRPTMLIRRLLHLGDLRIDLHAFIGSDDPGCYHTHPRWAWRLVLWGGYIEELESGEHRLWWPGRCGFVAPNLSHRVETPIYRRSYSLWVRLPTPVHEVELRGEGWEQQKRADSQSKRGTIATCLLASLSQRVEIKNDK